MTHPPFSHIMVIEENDLKFSARLVHSFLCKEFITSKEHEKWFTFARRPLRFSLQEYHVVTGLKVKQEKNSGLVKRKDDLSFWSKLLKRCGKINLKMIKDKYLKESMKNEAETEIGESSHVSEDVDGMANVSGRNKRKNVEQSQGRRSCSGLVQASFTTFEKKLSQKFSDRMDKLEKEVTDRLEKMDNEVTQLRTALLLSELERKTDQESGSRKSKVDTNPCKRKKT
ncbi:hypothetical protein N665_0179s0010 [Sinapis alba]|nr:hypothetical protein N665_0179s0010 [Sinapis alba]